MPDSGSVRGIKKLTSILVAGLVSIAALPLGAQTLTPMEEAAKSDSDKAQEEKAGFKISGWIESGFTGNFDSPRDNQNFGRLLDDRSNEFVMNQAAITAERVFNSKLDFDWGFKIQLLYGTDARYIHSLGMPFDQAGTGLYQGDVPEAYLILHGGGEGKKGVELQLGKFISLEGAEYVAPVENPFYSHTYMFNFGIPTSHTGALMTIHANETLDFMAGVTRGVNTAIDDNNDAPAFHGGVKVVLDGGKIEVVASTHIGPETHGDNSDPRYFNDVVITWREGNFKFITNLNYVRDDLEDAEAYGVAQYLIYSINKKLSVGIRGELWRDDDGFYVGQYADPSDLTRSVNGEPTIDPRTIGGEPTTYGALTIGLNIDLPLSKPLERLIIRPELRVDHAFDGRPFNDSSDDTMFTAAIDAIVTF
ncbi:MAG TPA: porin [Chthoniobacterales bacterium]|nr:porin [Chthoniobacterales bacterium]